VFRTYDDALAWCDLERDSAVALVGHAVRAGRDGLAWRLAYALLPYFNLRKPWTTWINTFVAGVDAALREDAPGGLANLVNGLGIAYKEVGRYSEARGAYERAATLYRELGDRQARAWRSTT
jgi:tetratricopeptide (TPR) repeat protein